VPRNLKLPRSPDVFVEAMREFEMARIDRELEILLSDNGPAILSLMRGGSLLEVDGKFFVLDREFCSPAVRIWPALPRCKIRE